MTLRDPVALRTFPGLKGAAKAVEEARPEKREIDIPGAERTRSPIFVRSSPHDGGSGLPTAVPGGNISPDSESAEPFPLSGALPLMPAKTEPDGEYVTRRALLGVGSFVAALPLLIPGAITLTQVAGPAANSPFTTVPSNPCLLPTLRAHPRILFTPTRLALLQARWANPDPNFVALKTSWNITGSGTISAMASLVKYLATGSLPELTNAYNIAIAQPYSLYRGQVTMYADLSPFVFDWCYNAYRPNRII